MEEEFVRVCPKCKSTDVSSDLADPLMAATGLFNNYFICGECGFKGMFFPEVKKEKLKS